MPTPISWSLVGYSLDEVKGQHHRLFVDPASRDSAAYRVFWEAPGRGAVFQTGEFRARRKGRPGDLAAGELQPDLRPGRAADQGGQVRHRHHGREAPHGRAAGAGGGDRPLAGRDPFRPRRDVLDANPNFLAVLGYESRPRSGVSTTACSSNRPTRPRRSTALLGRPAPGRVPVRHLPARRRGRPEHLDPGLLQPDPGHERHAVQGGQVRHRHHGADALADRGGQRLGADPDQRPDRGLGRRGIERLDRRDRQQPRAIAPGGGRDGRARPDRPTVRRASSPTRPTP